MMCHTVIVTTAPSRAVHWPTDGLCYGGDYNPEQWTEDVWREDVELMRAARINFVTVGVFSWARLQPEPHTWDFGWLDRVMDLLHGAQIRVDLATATASPPPWLPHRYPEVRPVDERGYRYAIGSRQTWSPASAVYREASLELVEQIAVRYRDHPALALWHVSNELGCHNSRCYSRDSAAAFRVWLTKRYADIEVLNVAWGTTFWSQHYTCFDEVVPPAPSTTFGNPAHLLDWRRYCSDALLDQFLAERAVLQRITPHIPVTTNFMVGMPGWAPGAVMGDMDYAGWAARLDPGQDIISTDHYLIGASDGAFGAHHKLSFAADHTRGIAGGRPWLLMEHSPSAVNWQPVNRAKRPGEMTRNSLSHVARGADGIAYFQFRASLTGAEKFHSALVPHAGPDTARWREAVQLGEYLHRLAEVRGSTVDAPVGIVFDWPSQWACEQDGHPSVLLQPADQALRAHRAFTSSGATCEVIGWQGDLTRYRVLVLPAVYLCSPVNARRVAAAAKAGAHVVVTPFTGIADDNDHVYPGGYPGALRELLGVRTSEFFPLAADEVVRLDDHGSGLLWSEELAAGSDVDVIAHYTDGHLAGSAAISCRVAGAGAAYYLSTVPDPDTWRSLAARVLAAAAVTPLPVAADVELVRRRSAHAAWLFVLNHSAETVSVPVAGHDVLTGRHVAAPLQLAAGGCAVLRQEV
jgi:beta-galactosidase